MEEKIIKDLRKKDLVNFSKHLGLNVRNLELLNKALTHSSYLKETASRNLESNEQLEFFGDAVLKLYISEYLMSKYSNYTEGQLSKLRASVVSEKVLINVANKLNLKNYLLLGVNEKKHFSDSILGDALEALLAIIYYECGSTKSKKFIIDNWSIYIEQADKNKDKENYKAALQEHLQAKKQGLPIYKLISESGPGHNKNFEMAVYVCNKELSRGVGKTKKEASQNAAKAALVALV